MKKQFIFLFAFLLSGMLLQAQTVTIGTGTNEQRGPISNYWGHDRYIDIYKPSDGLIAGYITKLEWHKHTSGLTPINIPVRIYLKETTDSIVASTSITWNTLIATATKVFDGIITPQLASGWIGSDLDISFQYTGTNNLMIFIACDYGGGGSSDADLYYYYTTSGNNTHAYYRVDNSIDDGSANEFTLNDQRSNIRIQFSPAPVCNAVSNLRATAITSGSADLKWHPNGTETQWLVSYKASTDVAWTNDVATDSTYSLSALQSNTQYTATIRSFCGVGDTGFVRTVTFITACGNTILPLTEGFENTATTSPSTPNCWSYIKTYSSGAINGSTTNPHTGSKCCYMYHSSSSPAENDVILISPYLNEDLSTLRITFWARNSTSSQIRVGHMTNPVDTSTFHQDSVISLTSSWAKYKYAFNNVITTNAHYIALSAKKTTEYNTVYLDDITIEPIPTCADIDRLTLDSATSTTIALKCTPYIAGNNYNIEYKIEGTNTWTPETSSDTAFSIGNTTPLTPNTRYVIRVQRDCGGGDVGAWSEPIMATTLQIPAVIPFAEDFEGTPDWVLVNGTQLSKWVIDTTVRNGGSKGLYISSDNGLTNTYVNDISVYATKLIEFDNAGDYHIQYDWKNQGEWSDPYYYDYLKVMLYPAATTFTAGYIPSETSSINLYGSIPLVGQLTWQTKEVAFTVPQAGIYKLVFYWRSDFSTVQDPAAAVDNIVITELACSAPTGVATRGITTTDATVHFHAPVNASSVWVYYKSATLSTWDSVNVPISNNESDTTYLLTNLVSGAKYQYYLKTDCSLESSYPTNTYVFQTNCEVITTLPWSESFEGITNDNEIPACMAATRVGNYVYTAQAASDHNRSAKTGSKYAYFVWSCDDYIFMPQFSLIAGTSYRFSFWYNTDGLSGWQKLEAKLCDGQTVQDTIRTLGAPLTDLTNTSYQRYVADFIPDTTGVYNFAIHCKANGDPYYLSIDDIQLSVTPTCLDEVSNLNLSGFTDTATANLVWSSTGTNFHIEYRAASATTWQTAGTSTDTNFALTGLNMNTQYEVRVQAVCTGNDGGEFTSFLFTTLSCTPLTTTAIPLYEGADSVVTPHLPTCWTGIAQNSNAKVITSSLNSISPPNSFDLYNEYSSNSQTTMLVSPPISPNVSIANLRTRFFVGSGYNGNLKVGIMTNPNNLATFIPADTVALLSGYWISAISELSNITQPTTVWYVAYIHGNATTQDIFIDDINIENIPLCADVLDFGYTRVTNDSIYIQYSSTAANFTINYRVAGTTAWLPITTTDTTYGIGGLQANTQYEIRVQSVCGSDVGVWTYSVFVTTTQIPAAIPFTETFETTPDWILVNGTQTNKWAIGTAANTNNTAGGSYGLYVSNDNGVTNAYSHTESYVYATKLLQFTNAGDYSIEFDWKSNGEAGYDYLRVWLAPANASITAGNSPSSSNWINLYGSNLQTQATWQHKQTMFMLPQAGMYKLVFYWRNDGSDGSNPPAAVDNISVTPEPCSRPVNTLITNITTTAADVRFQAPANAQTVYVYYKTTVASTWDSIPVSISIPLDTVYHLTGLQPGTEYKVYLKTICSATDVSLVTNTLTFQTPCIALTLPFLEEFTGPTFPPICWNKHSGLLDTVNPTPVTLTAPINSTYTWNAKPFGNVTSASNSACLDIYGDDQIRDWLITPQIDLGTSGNAVLEFNLAMTVWGGSGAATGTRIDDKFMVLVSSNGSWTINDTISVWSNSSTASHVFNNISTTGQRIVLPLTGKTGIVRIAFYGVSTITGNGDNALFIDSVSVTGPVAPICDPVTTVTTVATGTSVKVDWTAPAEQTQWKVYCLQTENLVASQIVSTPTHTFSGLQRGATYTFEVRNICGAEDTSVAVISMPVTINQCNNVSNVTVVRACPTTAIISFTAAAGQNQWQLSYQPTGGGNTIVKTINRNLDTITGLTPNASYEVKIRPVCGEGDTGNYSAPVSVQTGTCAPIENLTVPRWGVVGDSIFASWNNNECHLNWEMSVVPQGSPRGTSIEVNTYQGVYYKVDDPNLRYDVYVRGNCGSGEYGEWVMATSYPLGIAPSEASSVKVTLAPNPARDYTQLSIEGVSGEVEMTLLTLEGKLLKKETINCRPSITKDVTLQGLSKGTFLIRLVHKNWTKVEKLIVQ